MADRKSKQEVDYSKGMGATRCRECTHFHPNARTCSLVAGPIMPNYWCKLFEKRYP